MFSRFSVYLKANNSCSRQELYHGFTRTYKPSPVSIHIHEVANIRDYYRNGKFLNEMFYHSKPLHFRITSFKKGDQPTIYTKMNCRQVNWSDYQLQSIIQTDDVVSSVVSS